jgi:type III pantothenate kinase
MHVIGLDVGNSHTRVALLGKNGVERILKTRTAAIATQDSGLPAIVSGLLQETQVAGFAFCSVVPGVDPFIREQLQVFTEKVFQLTPESCVGLSIDYPNPREIGQDRLANAIGAQARHGTPAIVIDMGTAVTLDVVSPDRGYEGGVIAPGLALMTHYLHEKTAQLPIVDKAEWSSIPVIGKTTREAIGIGCKRGFNGMIAALVHPIYEQLRERCGKAPCLIAAGGDATFLEACWFDHLAYDEDITLMGLHEAFCRANPT